MAATPTPRLLDDQLCFGLYSASKKYTRFYQDALAEFHLTYPQYITMLALWETSPMTVRDLGDKLNLDSGTLTPLLKRLEKAGWITRKRSQQDERQVDISLTSFAIEQRDNVFEHVNDCMTLLDVAQSDYDQLLTQVDQFKQSLERVITENRTRKN